MAYQVRGDLAWLLISKIVVNELTCTWSLVSSALLQRSVQGPSECTRYWASAYGGGAVNTPEGRNSEGLGRLQEWANQNLMKFNSGTTNGPASDISWGWPIQPMVPWWWLGNPGGQQAEQGQAVYLDSNKGPAVPWLCEWRNGPGGNYSSSS